MPEVYAALCAELGDADPAARCLEVLARVGASVSLERLGVAREPFERLLASRPELPRSVLDAAYRGVRAAG
jgi:hypothetical protein